MTNNIFTNSIKYLKPDFASLLLKFYRLFGHAYRWRILIMFFGAVLSGVLELVGILGLYLMLKLLISVDSLDSNHFVIKTFASISITNTNTIILWLGVIIAITFILKNIYILLYYQYQHNTLKIWKNKLSLRLLEGYLYSPYIRLLQFNSDILVRNINSIIISALNGFVLSGLNFFANAITGLIILAVLYLKYFEVTTLIATILIVSTYLQNLYLKKRAVEIGKERNRLLSGQSRNVYQGLHSIKETKVGGKEQYFLSSFDRLNRLTVENDSKDLLLTRLPTHTTEIVIICSVVIICYAVLLNNQESSVEAVSSLGVLAAIAFRISPLMNRSLAALQSMNKSTNSMEILFNELHSIDGYTGIKSPDQTALPFQRDLALNDICFRYPKGGAEALNDISFKIQKGEFVGIVGESGSGKTTLVDIILGLLVSDHGSFEVDGVPIDSKNVRSWQQNLSFVPQKIYISDDSIRKNIAFGISDDQINDDRIWEILEKINLKDFILTKENQLDFVVGENGKHLSGGQQQRIGVARALYTDAPILVLDEATAALDVPTESKITQTLNAYRGQKTLITIAHRLSTVFDMDKILFFDDGHLAGVGNYKELYDHVPKFREMADLARIVPS